MSIERMRPFRSTISLTEALEILERAATAITRVETVPIAAASGRVAAADVVSTHDVPPFDRAAMDGYALIAADTAGASPDAPRQFRHIGVVFTAHSFGGVVAHGSTVEISTGAPLPAGADAVVMVEQTRRSDQPDGESDGARGGRVEVLAEVVPGQNLGRKGGDMKTGDTVVAKGAVLTPARIGAIAAVGRGLVTVYARPLVFIASTGNEVVEPGETLAPGQIHDVNRFTLSAMVEAHGGVVTSRPPVVDHADAIRDALDQARNADIVVLSGGSSVGERDLLVDVARERGDVLFHGIAVKPGKPTLLARIGHQLLIGMPGNPTSCLSNAYILLVPLLRATARLPPWRPERRQMPLSRTIVSNAGRHQFYSVRIEEGRAVPAFKGSGEITSLAHADGYIEIPTDQSRVEEGTVVTVTMF